MGTCRVACLGIEGSFSDQAAAEYFGEGRESVLVDRFEDICIAVREGSAEYGVIPVENTTTGIIGRSLDLIRKHDLLITGEKSLHIRHHLIGHDGARADEVTLFHSHPQAFEQCDRKLSERPGITTVACTTTASAVRQVKQMKRSDAGALASAYAAQKYDLKVIDENWHDHPDNRTRFLILSQVAEINPQADKISLSFMLPHQPGALASVLQLAATYGANVCYIGSRPIPGRNWEYAFHMDLDGDISQIQTIRMVRHLRRHTVDLKLVGNYKREADALTKI